MDGDPVSVQQLLEFGVGVLPIDRHQPSQIAAEIDRLGLGPVKLWLGIGVGSCARRSEASSRRSPRCGSSFQSRHELL